jgi:hypothetical protein
VSRASGVDHVAEAKRHLSAAIEHMDQAPDLDEISRYIVSTTRGDLARLVRRLTGLQARQAAPDGQAAG